MPTNAIPRPDIWLVTVGEYGEVGLDLPALLDR